METRSYKLSPHLMGVELAIIETPGKKISKAAGIARAQIIGTITFNECFQYTSAEQWKNDFHRHRVREDDPEFKYDELKPKWGWIVERVKTLPEPVSPPRVRGIVYARDCEVPN